MGAVENVILHEIAHALAGQEAGHGPRWRAVALWIGCDGAVFYHQPIVGGTYPCQACGDVVGCRHRLWAACVFLGVANALLWLLLALVQALLFSAPLTPPGS